MTVTSLLIINIQWIDYSMENISIVIVYCYPMTVLDESPLLKMQDDVHKELHILAQQ